MLPPRCLPSRTIVAPAPGQARADPDAFGGRDGVPLNHAPARGPGCPAGSGVERRDGVPLTHTRRAVRGEMAPTRRPRLPRRIAARPNHRSPRTNRPALLLLVGTERVAESHGCRVGHVRLAGCAIAPASSRPAAIDHRVCISAGLGTRPSPSTMDAAIGHPAVRRDRCGRSAATDAGGPPFDRVAPRMVHNDGPTSAVLSWASHGASGPEPDRRSP